MGRTSRAHLFVQLVYRPLPLSLSLTHTRTHSPLPHATPHLLHRGSKNTTRRLLLVLVHREEPHVQVFEVEDVWELRASGGGVCVCVCVCVCV